MYMKYLVVLSLLLSFSFVSVARHNKIKDPSYHEYDIHMWSDSEARLKARLQLARKGDFRAQIELVKSYVDKEKFITPISYPEAIYWSHKVLEHKCGWDWMELGLSLLQQRPHNKHNINDTSLDITLALSFKSSL